MSKLGRPQIGHTRKVSLTLDADTWKFLEQKQVEHDANLSMTLRYLLQREAEGTSHIVEK